MTTNRMDLFGKENIKTNLEIAEELKTHIGLGKKHGMPNLDFNSEAEIREAFNKILPKELEHLAKARYSGHELVTSVRTQVLHSVYHILNSSNKIDINNEHVLRLIYSSCLLSPEDSYLRNEPWYESYIPGFDVKLPESYEDMIAQLEPERVSMYITKETVCSFVTEMISNYDDIIYQPADFILPHIDIKDVINICNDKTIREEQFFM